MPDANNPAEVPQTEVVDAGPPIQTPTTTTTASPGFLPQIPAMASAALGVSFQNAPAVAETLASKLTDSHLASVIEQAGQESQLLHDERTLSMKLTFAALAAVLLVVFALCALFLYYGKPELATPIVTLIVGLLAGGAGGFGFGRSSVKPDKLSSSS